MLLFAFAIFPACAPSAIPASGAPEVLTVVGDVTVRGAEPFSAYVLETAGGNSYVLEFDAEASRGLTTPARIRATGTLYRSAWAGRLYAHLRVTSWERVAE